MPPRPFNLFFGKAASFSTGFQQSGQSPITHQAGPVLGVATATRPVTALLPMLLPRQTGSSPWIAASRSSGMGPQAGSSPWIAASHCSAAPALVLAIDRPVTALLPLLLSMPRLRSFGPLVYLLTPLLFLILHLYTPLLSIHPLGSLLSVASIYGWPWPRIYRPLSNYTPLGRSSICRPSSISWIYLSHNHLG